MTISDYQRVSLDESPELNSESSFNDHDTVVPLEEIKHDKDIIDEPPITEEPVKYKDHLPWKQLGAIYLITISDSIALSIVAPFLPEMCRNRFGIPEEQIGIASGMLQGGFSLATFVTSGPLGHLSDLYGRKKLILMGLISGTFCTLFFGVSPYYWLALLLRLIAGATNANISLCKSVLADMTTGKARTLAYAYQAASFSLARAISSSVSAATVGIIIPGVPLFDDPYFLPCFIGGIVNAIGFVATVILIPETLQKKKGKEKKGDFSMKAGLKEMGRDKLMRNLVILYCLNSFANGGLLLAMVLIMSLGIDYHGLGFTAKEIGIVFTWFGACAAIFQAFCFKRLIGALGPHKTYLMGCWTLALGTFLLPTCTLLYWAIGINTTTQVISKISIAISGFTLAVGFMTALPIISTMQSNAANPERVGLVTGTAQGLSGLFRSMGPPLSGMIFSLGVAIKFPFILFWLLCIVYFICYFMLRRLNPVDLARIEGKQTEVELELTPPHQENTDQIRLLVETVETQHEDNERKE